MVRSLTDGGGAADGGGRVMGVQCWVCRLLGRPDFREFSRQLGIQILCSRQMSFIHLFIHSGVKPSILQQVFIECLLCARFYILEQNEQKSSLTF